MPCHDVQDMGNIPSMSSQVSKVDTNLLTNPIMGSSLLHLVMGHPGQTPGIQMGDKSLGPLTASLLQILLLVTLFLSVSLYLLSYIHSWGQMATHWKRLHLSIAALHGVDSFSHPFIDHLCISWQSHFGDGHQPHRRWDFVAAHCSLVSTLCQQIFHCWLNSVRHSHHMFELFAHTFPSLPLFALSWGLSSGEGK